MLYPGDECSKRNCSEMRADVDGCACPVIRGPPRGDPGHCAGADPHARWRHFIPSVASTGRRACQIRCAYAGRGLPRTELCASLQRLGPTSSGSAIKPILPKMQHSRPHWSLRFQPRLRYALGTWRQPLGKFSFSRPRWEEFWAHASDKGRSEIRGAWARSHYRGRCQCPLGSQRLDVEVGDAKVRPAISRPHIPRRERPDIPLRCQRHFQEFESCIISGGIVSRGGCAQEVNHGFILAGR